MSVEVILLENIHCLGKVGELKKVKPGYARNYLLRFGKARRATDENIATLEKELDVFKEQAANLQAQAEDLAAKLAELDLSIEVKSSGGGKLFGSVTAVDIVNFLEKRGIKLSKQQIILPEGRPIRVTGVHEIMVNLEGGVQAKLNLTVHTTKIDD